MKAIGPHPVIRELIIIPPGIINTFAFAKFDIHSQVFLSYQHY